MYELKNPLVHHKLAFYPLFPVIWKISGIDSEKIIFFNYALFADGLILLSLILIDDPGTRIFYYCISLMVPTSVIFYLPYAESVFMLTFALGVWGLFKNKYWLYFSGIFLFSAARPSALIFTLALAITDVLYFIRYRNSNFIKESRKKIMPGLCGFTAVSLMQWYYTGSLTAYFDALNFWPAESGFFNTILDWSVEGFGMSAFSIFFLALPAFIYLVAGGVKSFAAVDGKHKAVALFEENEEAKKDYLLRVSLAFGYLDLYLNLFVKAYHYYF